MNLRIALFVSSKDPIPDHEVDLLVASARSHAHVLLETGDVKTLRPNVVTPGIHQIVVEVTPPRPKSRIVAPVGG